MGEGYLEGRQIWNGGRDPRYDRIFKLLANPEDPNSPWNSNAWNTPLEAE
jgi:hypothetical protein